MLIVVLRCLVWSSGRYDTIVVQRHSSQTFCVLTFRSIFLTLIMTYAHAEAFENVFNYCGTLRAMEFTVALLLKNYFLCSGRFAWRCFIFVKTIFTITLGLKIQVQEKCFVDHSRDKLRCCYVTF